MIDFFIATLYNVGMIAAIIIRRSHNILFELPGNLTISVYGLMISLGLIAAFVSFCLLSKKFALSDETFNFYSTAVMVSILLGFGAATLFQSVYNWIENGFKNFSLGGMTFLGGLIGGVGAFLLATIVLAKGKVRRDFWKVANLMMPSIPLAHGFGRVGCFFAGCCYGLPSDLPFAVKYADRKLSAVLPTQLFEALFLFTLFAAMLVLLIKYGRIDLMMLVYLYGYAVWRFFIEYFRGDPRGEFIPGVTPSQFQSIIMLLIAGALTLYIFYFDLVPFRGKDKVGRDFRLVAAEEFAETAEKLRAAQAEKDAEERALDEAEAAEERAEGIEEGEEGEEE